jgi:hypothetical protein
MKPPLTDAQKLANLADALVEDIMSMSDKEIRQEIIEAGEDPDKIVARVQEIIEQAIALCK